MPLHHRHRFARTRSFAALSAALGTLLLQAGTAHAQGVGIATLGATGGLTIPSAYVLGSGDLALSYGDYLDPRLGTFSVKENMSMGIGLFSRLEIFGRIVNYQNPRSVVNYGFDINGPRDLSANFKFQIPIDHPSLPKFAIGATDIGGRATNFKSVYGVVSDQFGPVRLTFGYGQGSKRGNRAERQGLDGAFGGAEVKLLNTRATLLAESDGVQKHVGLRYYSEVLPWLGDGQLIGTVQRSIGATNTAGRKDDSTSLNLSLIIPFAPDENTRRRRVEESGKPLAPLADFGTATTSGNGNPMVATTEDRLDALYKSLSAMGLDRVKVGVMGNQLVVEYENYRYLQNEADALGVVLGLAAEQAPAGVTRAHAITLKAGQSVFETSVDIESYRLFLRDGDARQVKASLGFGRLPGYDGDSVQWAGGEAGQGKRKTWLRVELKPQLNYTLATEYGLFDYSLALAVRGSVDLWKGATLYSDVVQRVDNSPSMDPGQIYASSQIRNGVKTVALQQSFWVGPRWFNSVGVGRYEYGENGVEGESIYYLPWNGDSLHLKGIYQTTPHSVKIDETRAYSGSYRYHYDTQTWLEAGYQQYTDRSTGPSFALTRWFGDVGLQLSLRKGGRNTYAALELNFPLTPREGMKAGLIQATGTPRYAQSIRTIVGQKSLNFIDPNEVRSVNLNYKAENELLNSGRVTPDDIRGQVQRMRESFYLYARDQVN